MGLENVQQNILTTVEQEAEALQAQGRAEGERLKQEAVKKVEAYKLERAEHTKKLSEQLERRETAQAEFDVRKKVLDAKKAITEQAFEQARKTLADQALAKRKSQLKKLLTRARKEIDVGRVYVSSADKKLIKQLVSRSVDVKEKKMLGGLIAETSDGTISVNYSFEELLDALKEEYMQEINGVLFKN